MASSNATPQGATIFELNNGQKVPALGFGAMKKGGGTFPASERDYVKSLIAQAINAGYRTIDTSRLYQTEDLVGQALRETSIPREEFTIITKLAPSDTHDVRGAFERSRALLGTYIDIYIMHWPQGFDKDDPSRPLDPGESPTYIEVYKKMQELVGPECGGIGVGNFTIRTLEPLLNDPGVYVVPVVNEIEIQPRNPNLKLVPYCLENGIRPIAWGPLAGGISSQYTNTTTIYDDPLFKALSSKYDLSAGTVILSWLVQRGVIVVPHSSSPTRLAQNRQLAELTEDEMQELNSFHEKAGRQRVTDEAFFDFGWKDTPGKGRTFMGWSVVDLGWEDEEGNWLT
ncbi:unnamed protein product [Penicillium pancosmium]